MAKNKLQLLTSHAVVAEYLNNVWPRSVVQLEQHFSLISCPLIAVYVAVTLHKRQRQLPSSL